MGLTWTVMCVASPVLPGRTFTRLSSVLLHLLPPAAKLVPPSTVHVALGPVTPQLPPTVHYTDKAIIALFNYC